MPWWIRALVALSWLKIAAALPGYAIVTLPLNAATPFPAWVYASHVIIFTLFGTMLLLGGRRDRRAQLLGTVLLLAASLFVNRPLEAVPPDAPRWLAESAAALRIIEPGAFRSLLAWMFASSFPREALSGWWQRVALTGTLASGALGIVLFVVGLVDLVMRLALSGSLSQSSPLLTASPDGLWRLNTILTLSALPLIVLNSRAAGITDRRRSQLFVWALVLGTGPILAQVVLESAIPAYGTFMNQHASRMWSGAILYPVLWTGLATAAYAVYAGEVLSVRLVIRRAIRYALARGTIVGLMAIPFAAVFWIVYQERDQPLAALLGGQRQLVLLALVSLGLILLRVRRPLLDSLDRRFFREQYDARRILGRLIDDTRKAPSVDALADRLAVEIDRALHVELVHLLLIDAAKREFGYVDGAGAALPAEGALATLLSGGVDPMDVDIETPRHPLQRLPDPERSWLIRGGYRLLVPVKSSRGTLAGVLALGPKRSELPFSPGDRWLLSAIAASAAVALENLSLRSSTPSASDRDPVSPKESDWSDAALECERCQTLQPDLFVTTCTNCGGLVRQAPVPRYLRGLRIERRIGTGGMGVVYRAIDTELERIVAVKTLTTMSADDARRLRREARAMAAVGHPNVATIFAVEMWHQQPLLVVEYFSNGTLRDRLRRGPLEIDEALALGEQLSAGLEHIHQRGILHRDIKPSNIGFDAGGTAKLLDFGLAKIIMRGVKESSAQDTTSLIQLASFPGSTIDTAGVLIGTPLYLAPELLEMQSPDRRSDLWALALVLYEAIAGSNPLSAPTTPETLERIKDAHIPDLRKLRESCPARLTEFFRHALAIRPQDRFQSAEELRAALRRIDGELAT